MIERPVTTPEPTFVELQLFIIVAFAVGAGIFVVAASIGLLINKVHEVRTTRSHRRIHKQYVALCSELLLWSSDDPEFETSTTARLAFYERITRPLKNQLHRLRGKTQGVHRAILKRVLLDLAKDMSGESLERLNYLFYELGIVDEELARLKDRRWWIRAQAARDLGLTRARRAMEALAEALEDPKEDVRYEAMRALAATVGVDSLETILARHEQFSLWNAVELSIIVMQFREQAVPILVRALQSRSTSVVLFSIEMLAEIGFVAAVEPLRELARSYPNVVVRAKAMEALGRLGDGRAEPLLLREIHNPIPELRLNAIRALERIGTPAAVDPLMLRLPRADLQEQVLIVTALARSGARGMEAVRSLETGDAERLRAVAEHVLELVES